MGSYIFKYIQKPALERRQAFEINEHFMARCIAGITQASALLYSFDQQFDWINVLTE
jgi:hypothetical protein